MLLNLDFKCFLLDKSLETIDLFQFRYRHDITVNVLRIEIEMSLSLQFIFGMWENQHQS